MKRLKLRLPLLPKSVWPAVGLVLLIIAAIPSNVLAHGFLIRSEPASNASLTDPPREVRLWFSEPISPKFSTAQLLDINGQPIKLPGIHVDPAEPTLMVLTLPELSSGLYNVRWKVLSEADGHFTQGPLVFGVGETADPNTAGMTEAEVSIPLPEAILRWFNFGALLALVGSLVVVYLVLAPPNTTLETGNPTAIVRGRAQRRVLGWARWFNGVALLAGVGLLSWQIIASLDTLPDGVPVWGVGWQLLSQTRWGILWLVRQSILLVLISLIPWLPLASEIYPATRRSRLALLGVTLLLPTLCITQALTGHAAALSGHIALAVVVDALHLLAAGMWVGGLLALIVGLLPLTHPDRSDFTILVRTCWRPFSRLAVLSVGLLVATGLYSTGRQIASIDALLTTTYGQMLMSKIGLILGVGAFGLINSLLLHPALAALLARLLGRPSGWTPLRLNRLPYLILAEGSLGLMVVLATGLLTSAPPARGPEFEIAPDQIPMVLNQTVDDMVVSFSAAPNRPGQNVFSVRAVSTRRPSPAEVLRLILRFTFLGEDMGRSSVDAVEIEPGLYQAGGSYLSLAGPWQVQVVIRRAGIEDSVANFNWTVAPPGEARSVVISNRPLASSLTLASAGLLLLILLIIVGSIIWRRNQTGLARFQAKLQSLKRNFQHATKQKAARTEANLILPAEVGIDPAAGPNPRSRRL